MKAATGKARLGLRDSDLAMFAAFRVPPEVLRAAQIERVTDAEAREKFGIAGEGDMSGIAYPYFLPNGNGRVTCRVRRDHPEIEDGQPKNKYMSAFGDRRHLYLPPNADELLKNPETPALFVESEKAQLALSEWAKRTGRALLVIGTGGCYGWSGKIGIATDPSGTRVDEKGPLPDLDYVRGRRCAILFDQNAATNPKVQAARAKFAGVLKKRGCDVTILDLPPEPGVNGPDDFLAKHSDDDMLKIFEVAPQSTELIRSEEGKIKPLLANAITVLSHAPEWQGVLAYNEFSLYVVSKKPAPWQTSGGANWVDVDDIRTTEWLQHNGILINSRLASEAVQAVAHTNRFHPVRTYLESLTWDRQPRIGEWLTTYLGVDSTPFSRAVGPRYLISAVARIQEPGCRDHTLVLEGPQGIEKSTALKTLAGPEWFSDSASDAGNKDALMELHGVWIKELPELASIKHSQLARVKAFLTTSSDHFRQPYGRRAEHIPRSNVFAGSVNDATYLSDETGNRRFWPVRCGSIDIPAIARDRDQIWAEARKCYLEGMPWWLESKALNALATDEQDQRYEEGVWDSTIIRWLDNPIAKGGGLAFSSTTDKVIVSDILVHGIGKKIEDCRRSDQMQVARCLTHQRWQRKREPRGERRWFYQRPEGRTPPESKN